MKRLLLMTASAGLLAASPAFAQSMGSMPGMQMPGMQMPAKQKPKAKPKKRTPATKAKPAAKAPTHAKSAKPATSAPSGHEAQDMQSMPGMTMPMENGQDMHSMPGMTMPPAQDQQSGHDMQSMPGMDMGAMQPSAKGGTDLPAGNAPPPPVPTDLAADRSFPPSVMAEARAAFEHEQGGQNFHQVLFNLAEIQIRNGRDGYRWDGEGWFGGDINRLVVKSEGEGTFREGVDSAEVQALYSRAIGPYFNLQAGIRHDFQPSPTRTYATVGVEGLAPYMFDTEAALFLSNKGDLLGRLEGWYDERITQRLVLQPRVEFNLSAQDVPEDRLGAGLTDAELGLRLRYEISRQFAPYVGISYETKAGRTADFARADGQDVHATSLVLGIRTWF